MKRIRVLVVDDSVVVRRILRDVLAEDSAFEVAGVAANGKIALSMVEQVSPDVVTLDVEMPDMDGIEVLRHLRVSSPSLPVVMFSTLTQRGAEATLDALALGARDYVTKPANIGSVSVGMQRIREELLPKLKAICGGKAAVVPSASSFTPRPTSVSTMADRTGPLDIVVIGCSTGGPNALSEILPQFPADFPVPVAVVQHMPPTFTKFLAERLNASCALQVLEAGVDEKLQPGTIWIAPGDYHVSVYSQGTAMRLRRHQAPPENSCRPAVDVLFRTAAMTYGGRVLAVILTGMGQDGLRGAQELKSVNATVIAQDEASSVVWGMPGFVVQAGLADRVVPLGQMAQEIMRRVVASHKSFAVHG
jgi:two-component system chemotaxis response regulator CheB